MNVFKPYHYLTGRWQKAKLKTVVELRSIRADEKTSELNYIGLENIESWTGRFLKTQVYEETNDEEQINSANNCFEAGDVLFGKLRPYLAKAHLAQHSGTCTTELLVLRPKSHCSRKI